MMREFKLASGIAGFFLIALVLTYPFRSPQVAFSLSGFDSNLIGLSEQAKPGAPRGEIHFSSSTIEIRALPGSSPTVYLAGTKTGFSESLSLAMVAEKQMIGYLAMFRAFNALKGNEARFTFVSPSHTLWVTLLRNFTVFEQQKISSFSFLSEYRIEFTIRQFESMRILIANSTWNYERTWTSPDWLVGQTIFTSIGSGSLGGESTILIRDYALQVFNIYPAGVQISDYFLSILVVSTTIMFGLSYSDLLVTQAKRLRRKIPSAFASLSWSSSSSIRTSIFSWTNGAFVLLTIPLMLAGYHVSDVYCFKLYSYVAANYGVYSTYPLTHSTTTAILGQGPPTYTYGLIYPPLSLYIWPTIGVIMSYAGQIDIRAESWNLAIKGTMTGFLYLGGLVTYKLSKTDEDSLAYGRGSLAWYLLSPPLLVDAALWGETDSIPIFFALVSALFLRKKMYNLSLFMILLTMFVKQTGVFLAIPLLICLARKQGIRSTLRSFFPVIPALFLLLAPLFLLGFRPSSLFEFFGLYTIGRISTPSPDFSVVSKWVFNLPTLIAAIQGFQGNRRFNSSDFLVISGLNLTMQQFAGLALIVTLIMLMIFWLRRNQTEDDLYIFVALFTLAVDLIMTRIAPTWTIYGLPFLILSRKRIGTYVFAPIVAIWTLTSTLAQLRSLVDVGTAFRYIVPSLYWKNNWVMAFVVSIFNNDILITILTLGNILVLVLVAKQFIRRHR